MSRVIHARLDEDAEVVREELAPPAGVERFSDRARRDQVAGRAALVAPYANHHWPGEVSLGDYGFRVQPAAS